MEGWLYTRGYSGVATWAASATPLHMWGVEGSSMVPQPKVVSVHVTHEVYANEMYAYEVHAREMHSCEVHAREMHAHEVHAHEVHACEMHAYEVHALEMHAHE